MKSSLGLTICHRFCQSKILGSVVMKRFAVSENVNRFPNFVYPYSGFLAFGSEVVKPSATARGLPVLGLATMKAAMILRSDD